MRVDLLINVQTTFNHVCCGCVGRELIERNQHVVFRTVRLEKIHANHVARFARSWFGPNETRGGIFVVGGICPYSACYGGQLMGKARPTRHLGIIPSHLLD